MQSVLSYSHAPFGGALINDEQIPSFDELSEELIQSFFSSPEPDEYNQFNNLCFTQLNSVDAEASNFSPVECEKAFSNEPHLPSVEEFPEELLDLLSSSPASTVATEPLTDPSYVYKALSDAVYINASPQPSYSSTPLVRKRTHVKTLPMSEYEFAQPSSKRRKATHDYINDDGIEPVTLGSESPQSFYSGTGSSESSLNYTSERKRVSNREAAHRYRQKVKMRAATMDKELRDSFKSMNHAKQAYEKALESFLLLQRVVEDLTIPS